MSIRVNTISQKVDQINHLYAVRNETLVANVCCFSCIDIKIPLDKLTRTTGLLSRNDDNT